MAKITHVPVEKVRTEGLQARATINQDAVREYAEAATTGGATLPPIVVYRDGQGNVWVGDGVHRLAAAKSVGQKTIAAEVRDGTRVDALRHALGANGLHGLRRTNADKAHAVKMAYEHRGELGLPEVPAARAIAEIVGVSHEFARLQLSTVDSWREAGARTGADGRTRELPPVPTRRPVSAGPSVAARGTAAGTAPKAGGGTQGANGTGGERAAGAGTGKTEGTEGRGAQGVVDERGRHIPANLLPVWNRRQEVQEAATAVSRVRAAVRAAQDGRDPLWGEINYSSVLNYLDRAYTEIAAAKPWCVCPMCQGIGCRACKERGLMGKYRFDNAIAPEFKK